MVSSLTSTAPKKSVANPEAQPASPKTDRLVSGRALSPPPRTQLPLVAPRAFSASSTGSSTLTPSVRPPAVYKEDEVGVVAGHRGVQALLGLGQEDAAKLKAVVFNGPELRERDFCEVIPTRRKNSGLNTDKHFAGLRAFSLAGVTLVDDQGEPLANPFGTVLSKLSYGQFPFLKDCLMFDMRLKAHVPPRDLEVVTSYLIQHNVYARVAKDGNGFVLYNPAKKNELEALGFDVEAMLADTEQLTKAPGTHGTPFEPCAVEMMPDAVEWNDESLGGSTDARTMGENFIVKGADIATTTKPADAQQQKQLILQLHGELLGARAMAAAGIRVPSTVIRQRAGYPVMVQQRITNGTALAVALTGNDALDDALWEQNLNALLPSILIGDTDRLGLCLANSIVPNAPGGKPDRQAAIAFIDFGAMGHTRAGSAPKHSKQYNTNPLRDEFNERSVLGQLLFHIKVARSKRLFDRWTPQQMATAIHTLRGKVGAMQQAILKAHAEWTALQLTHDPVQELQGVEGDDHKDDHSGAYFAKALEARMQDLEVLADKLQAAPADKPTSDIVKDVADAMLTAREAAQN